MKNITLPVIVDCIFTAFTTFLLAFVLLNYGIKKPFSYIIAVCIGLLVALITFKYLTGKQKGIKLKKREEILCNKVIIQLSFFGKTYAENLFIKAFENTGLKPIKKYGGIYLESEKTVHYFCFSFDGITKQQVADCFNKAGKENKIIIWADKFSKEICDFTLKFNGRVELNDGKKAFLTLKENQLLPEITCPVALFDKGKPNVKQNFLDKKKAKNYLLFGTGLLFMSYFVYFKIYYIIFGCLFLTLSLIAVLFGKNNKTV